MDNSSCTTVASFPLGSVLLASTASASGVPEEPKEESNTQEGASLQDQVSGQLGLGPSSPSHDSDPAETQSEQDQAKVELPNVVTPVAEVNPAQPPVGPVLPDVQTQPATTEANMPAGDSVIVPQPIPEKKGLFGVDWKELVFGSKAKNNE